MAHGIKGLLKIDVCDSYGWSIHEGTSPIIHATQHLSNGGLSS